MSDLIVRSSVLTAVRRLPTVDNKYFTQMEPDSRKGDLGTAIN